MRTFIHLLIINDFWLDNLNGNEITNYLLQCVDDCNEYEIKESREFLTIAFERAPDIRPGGGYTDEPLFSQIQEVYAKYFRPETEYKRNLDYDARDKYSFVNLERREYLKTREYNADDYVLLIGTHSDHITLKEPNKSYFYEGINNR